MAFGKGNSTPEVRARLSIFPDSPAFEHLLLPAEGKTPTRVLVTSSYPKLGLAKYSLFLELRYLT